MVAGKRDTSKKRESILEAARQAFINEGYDNASMDRIAEIAGASKRTVYNHFPSKEDLFREALNRLIGEAVALKQIKYDPKRSLEAQLGDFANAKMEIMKNPSWLGMMKVTTGVFISNPNLVKETMMRAEDEEDTLAAWLREAHEDGRLNVPNPGLAADAFWAMVGGAFFWPAIFLGPMKAGEAKTLKKELIEMFLCRYGK
ncbi:MAG: TetR/AcrR family transcriptional regulator [Proteobacteria bacterium]|nr:TetR/AcrR family transcriptional regulator [Pseudomonadota bacterium]